MLVDDCHRIGAHVSRRSSFRVVFNFAEKLVTLEIKVQRHYGKSSDENVDTIKQLYARLDLKSIFAKFEEDSYARIENLIKTYK